MDRAEAGLAGLHTYDCWEADPENSDHDMCREIVAAVLLGIDRKMYDHRTERQMQTTIHPSLDKEAEALILYACRVLAFPEVFDAEKLAALAPRMNEDREFAFEDLKDAVYRVNRGHASPSAIDQALLPLLHGTWHK